MTRRRTPHAAALLVCTLLLAACLPGGGPPGPVTLYTLRPAGTVQPVGNAFADFTEMVLIMPVRLAPQLQGSGLVVRQAGGEVRTAPGHLWAGPLDEQIAAALVADLQDLLATEHVAVAPGPRFAATRYQVELEVDDFSGDDRSFFVRAVYTVSDVVHRRMLARRAFHRTLPVPSPDHAGSVAAASQAMADLGREVAAALLAAERQPETTTRTHAP